MDDTLFNELLESIHEAGQIVRGEKKASRTFEYSARDVKKFVIKRKLKTLSSK
jgi:hypothetical protein